MEQINRLNMSGDGYHSVTQWWYISYLGVVGGGRGVDGLLVLGGVSGVAVDDLHAHLLGQGELDGLAGGGSKLGHALLQGLGHLLNLGHGDALVLGQVLAGDSGQADGLVDTGLDGLGVGHINGGLDGGDNGDVVAGLLGDLLAVVVSVAVAVSVLGGLAHGHHLGHAPLLEGNLDGLGGGGLGLGLVGVGADLVVDLLDGLGADSPGDVIALLLVDDGLPHQLHGAAHGLESGHADLSGLNNILDGAVVLGVLVLGLVVGGLVVGGGRGVGRGVSVSRGGGVLVGGDGDGQGDQGEKCEGLHVS